MKYILILSNLILVFTASSQTLDWVYRLGGTLNDIGHSTTTDKHGNVYTKGYFNGTVDFDPGSGVFNLTSSAGGSTFIQKLDKNGSFIWANETGEGLPISSEQKDLIVDDFGNVYTHETFSGFISPDLDPGPGTVYLTRATTGRGNDCYIRKLDSLGNFVWVKQLRASSGGSNINSFAMDNNNNLCIVGGFTGIVDFDPNSGIQNRTAVPGSDFFTLKINSSGSFIWVRSGISAIVWQVATDDSGNIYSVGDYNRTKDFDPSSTVFNLTSLGGSVFLQKLDSSGNFVYARNVVNSSEYLTFTADINIGPSNNIYLIGNCYGVASDFDPDPLNTANHSVNGYTDIFLSKLTPNGDLIWVKFIEGSSSEISRSLAIDKHENLYTSGYFLPSSIDFDPGPGTTILTCTSNRDGFVQILDSSGNFINVFDIDGSGSYGTIPISIELDQNDNLVIVGKFTGTTDFDPSVGVTNLTSVGGEDIFIQKLSSIYTSINENNLKNAVFLFPNPTNGDFTIDVGGVTKLKSLMILDINGRLIKKITSQNKSEYHINFESAPGMYFLNVVTEDEQITLKLIKK